MYEPLRGLHAKHLSPYGRVVPFTYRDSRTFIQTLESMRDYLVNVIVPHIDAAFSEYNNEVNSLVDSLNAIIDEVNENVERTADVVERGELLLQAVNEAIVELQNLQDQSQQILDDVNASVALATDAASMAADSVEQARNAALDVLESWQVNWSQIESKPPHFPPSPHKHSATDIDRDILDPARLPIASTTVAGATRYATAADIADGASPDAAIRPGIARLIAADATAFYSGRDGYPVNPVEYSRRIIDGQQEIYLLGDWRPYPVVFTASYTGARRTIQPGWARLIESSTDISTSGAYLNTKGDTEFFKPAISGHYSVTAWYSTDYGTSEQWTFLGIKAGSVADKFSDYIAGSRAESAGNTLNTLSVPNIHLSSNNEYSVFRYTNRNTQSPGGSPGAHVRFQLLT